MVGRFERVLFIHFFEIKTQEFDFLGAPLTLPISEQHITSTVFIGVFVCVCVCVCERECVLCTCVRVC